MTFFNSKAKELEANIDSYLDRVATSGLIFFEAIKAYVDGNFERFETKYRDITTLETDADNMRRDIKHKLYTYMLIPESRGDVLDLLEALDDVVDVAEKVVEQFSIESPTIPEFAKKDYLALAEISTKAVEELVKAVRTFFKEIDLVSNYINKVYFYEHEVDDIEEQLKRKVFRSTEVKELSNKVHLRYFAERIAKISDVAETVAEKLSVYTIKRKI